MASLLFVLYLSARRAVAAAYFREGLPDSIQKAMKWDPANAQYYDALATLMHVYGDPGKSGEILRLYRQAARLSPHDAAVWADLGTGYDWAGNSEEAREAFQQAVDFFPNSPEIHWRQANFYVRTGKTSEALRALKMVLEEDETAGKRVFQLATNATGDRKAVLEMLPARGPIFLDYLNFQLEKDDINEAERVWERVLQLRLPFELREAFPYFDALLRHKETGRLLETWIVLAQRFPGQIPRPDGSNLVTNGGFESEILNGGFDWRILPVEGAIVRLDESSGSNRSRSLRIAFDGSRNIDYGHVFQYVPVQPKSRYELYVRMRWQGITTDSGPRLQICDAYNIGNVFASTENAVGSSDWSERKVEFTTLADTQLLLVRIVRPISSMLDNQIAGVLQVSDVRLKAQ